MLPLQFNWYTRRIGLATIFKMTELYMLQDSSMGHQETWTFLERRIEEGQHLQAFLAMGESNSRHMGRAMNSAFLTVSLSTKHFTY